MIIVLPTCAKDEHLALLNLELARRLDKPVANRCIIPIELGYDAHKVIAEAKNYFATVETFQFPRWGGNKNWPRPQNWCWQCTVRYIQDKHKEPWFWWEPDCVPLCPGWITTLEKAYIDGKKPFMGFWVQGRSDWKTPYMAGIGVYPPNVGHYSPASLLSENVAWDMVLGPNITAYCNKANHLIEHHVNSISFPNKESTEVISRSAILYHKCKDGSLPNLILNPKGIAEAISKGITAVVNTIRESPFTVVITNCARPDRVREAFQSCLDAGIKNIVISASREDQTLARVHNSFLKMKSDVVIDAISDDKGCNEMWLRGLMRVKTPWVQILHDDDIELPGFRNVLRYLNEDVGFIYWPSQQRHYESKILSGVVNHFPNRPQGKYPTSVFLDLIMTDKSYAVSPVQGMFRTNQATDALQEFSRIRNDFKLTDTMEIGNDSLLWLKACTCNKEFLLLSDPLTAFGTWSGSTTTNDLKNGIGKLLPFYDKMRAYFRANRLPSRKKIDLPRTTLMGLVWSEDLSMLDRTVRVLNYCLDLFSFQDVILFSHLAPTRQTKARIVGIHGIKDIMGFNLAVNKDIPPYIHSDFVMSIHEDGFPIRLDLWEPGFLNYDMIGAPWFDGVVGNTAFSLQSQRLLRELPSLVYYGVASDTIICRNLRPELEKKGITWAPTDVATRFSTEWVNHKNESFGFHGRTFGGTPAEKYVRGWHIIEEWEAENT